MSMCIELGVEPVLVDAVLIRRWLSDRRHSTVCLLTLESALIQCHLSH